MNLLHGLVIYIISVITAKGMKKYFENHEKLRIGKEGYKICDDLKSVYPIPFMDYLPFVNILYSFVTLMEYNNGFYHHLEQLKEENPIKKMTLKEKKEFEEKNTISTMNRFTDEYFKQLEKSVCLKFTDEIDISLVYVRIIDGKAEILNVTGLMSTLPKDKIMAQVYQRIEDAHIMSMRYSQAGKQSEIVYHFGKDFNGVFILYAIGFLEKYSKKELENILLKNIKIQLEEYLGISKTKLTNEDFEQFYNYSCQNTENQVNHQKSDIEDYFLYEFGDSKALIKIASGFKDIDIKEVTGPASKLSLKDLKAVIYANLLK